MLRGKGTDDTLWKEKEEGRIQSHEKSKIARARNHLIGRGRPETVKHRNNSLFMSQKKINKKKNSFFFGLGSVGGANWEIFRNKRDFIGTLRLERKLNVK